MDAPSLAKFQRDLLENQDKKALIIDQRFNGGGGIDQELLQILNQRKAYQTTRGRDSLDVKRPGQTFFGPMVVLQNERSASDAEMFPDGFRALGLGKLVGVPTSGQVIGTGSFTLLDGSAIRTPGAGVFTAKGENMENYGVPPDVYVDNTPADFLTGHDRQIEEGHRDAAGTDVAPGGGLRYAPAGKKIARGATHPPNHPGGGPGFRGVGGKNTVLGTKIFPPLPPFFEKRKNTPFPAAL